MLSRESMDASISGTAHRELTERLTDRATSVNVIRTDVARSVNNNRLAMMSSVSARASTSGKSQQTLPELSKDCTYPIIL